MTALWEVESAHQDAIASVQHALDLIGSIFAQIGESGGDPDADWPALDRYATRLQEIARDLETAMPAAIKQAIEEEGAHLDHLSDLADGASY